MVNRTGLMSMTGFATSAGESDGWSWAWDLRSVNGKGLDLRLRVPEGLERVEADARTLLQSALARGSVSLTLRLQRRTTASKLRLDPLALGSALEALQAVEAEAQARGVTLSVSSAADVLTVRGVMDTDEAEGVGEAAVSALTAALPDLIADLKVMRAAEGARLAGIIDAQISRIAELTVAAGQAADARRDDVARVLRENLAKVMQNAEGADEARVAQELALLAVKSDVTEELDRLRAHVTAAQDLLASGAPVGRKLDFLMQEFLREANTLCSKSQSAALTRVGLDLKVVIDQMREQVQNVE